jgi:PAS domain S-box-containing protein
MEKQLEFDELKNRVSKLEQRNYELQTELKKYKILFESFPYGITITDTEGGIIETNREAEKILGLRKRDHEQRTIDGEEWKLVRTDGSEMPPEEYASVIALNENKVVTDCEIGIVKGRDTTTWINVAASPLPLGQYGVVITYNDITAKLQLEKSLKESETRFKKFYENSGLYAYQLSPDGFIISVNETALNMLGYSREELLGQHVSKIYSESCVNKIKGLLKKLNQSGTIHNEELVIKTKKGGERHVLLNADAVQCEEGKTLYSLSIQTDITNRKKVENELLKLKKRNTTILETIPDMMFVLSAKGDILDYQTNNYDDLVLDPFDVIGSNIRDSMPDGVVQQIQQKIHTSLEKAQLQVLEYRIAVKKGVEDYEARFMPLSNDSVLTIVRNITEKKLTEQKVHENWDMFEKAFQSAPVISTISRIDDGKFLQVNDTFCYVTGYSREAALGKTSVELGFLKKEDREWLKQNVQRNGHFRNVEIKLSRADNSDMLCLYSGEVIEIQGVKRLLSTAVDITDRKDKEHALEEKKYEIEAYSKKLEDMNTALNVLLEHKGNEKDVFHKKILNDFKKLVFPYFFTDNERKSRLELLTNLDIIERNTKAILFQDQNSDISPFAVLTPMETQIAQMIREGRKSKEIADSLRMSIHTVYFHRENIRKKLNITKSGVNLTKHLQDNL